MNLQIELHLYSFILYWHWFKKRQNLAPSHFLNQCQLLILENSKNKFSQISFSQIYIYFLKKWNLNDLLCFQSIFLTIIVISQPYNIVLGKPALGNIMRALTSRVILDDNFNEFPNTKYKSLINLHGNPLLMYTL